MEPRNFDQEAAQWDENPVRVKLAEDVAGAIMHQVELTPDMQALDYGCGTGLLTFALAGKVRSVVGMDTSQGMVDVLAGKVARGGVGNVSARLIRGDQTEVLGGPYDLITINMALHHIPEIEPLLTRFYAATAPGGFLCVADLDLEDGQFHPNPDGVFHDGFDRAALRETFMAAGYGDVADETAAEVQRPGRDGQLRTFSIFLMTGRKGA